MILWHYDMNCYIFEAFLYIELNSCCLPTLPNVASYSIPNHPSRRYNAINNIWLDPMIAWNATKRVMQHDPRILWSLDSASVAWLTEGPYESYVKLLAWWRHEVQIFPCYWPFVRGNHLSPVNSQHKGQWRGALMFSLILTWTNGWVSNRDAGNLRRHCAHYGVTVMFISMDTEMMIHYIRNKIPYCPRLREFFLCGTLFENIWKADTFIFSLEKLLTFAW